MDVYDSEHSAHPYPTSPYLFAVGVPRSGTTLLQRMLDAHPQLTVANDSHFIPAVIKHVPVEEDPPLTGKLVDDVLTYRRFKRLKVDADVVKQAAKQAETYSQFVVNLYCRVAALHDKTYAGEKTPDYVRHLKRLHHLFPWARFIHIIRDGRDVALSVRQWGSESKGPGKQHPELWRHEPVGLIALWWRWLVNKGMTNGRDLGSHLYMEVKYDALVDSARAELEGICRFLDLPYSTAMENFHLGKTVHDKNKSAKAAWLPATKGIRNWQTELSEYEIELFEALAGDLLTRLGYTRVTRTCSPAILKRAQHCRDHMNNSP